MDLRIPIGSFFALLGALLLTQTGARGKIEAGPVNLWAGLAMLVFGGVLLVLARRSRA